MTCDAVLAQYLYWVGRWKWDYSIKGKEYTWDDAVRRDLQSLESGYRQAASAVRKREVRHDGDASWLENTS